MAVSCLEPHVLTHMLRKMLHRAEQPSKRERKHGRFLELDRPTHLERGSPGCADMVAHLADHLIRAALDVVIEYDADLLAREKVHKAGQMAKIEAIFRKRGLMVSERLKIGRAHVYTSINNEHI